MTVQELIVQLLNCPMNTKVMAIKELTFGYSLVSDIRISKANDDIVTFDFDLPEGFYCERRREK